VLAVFGWHREVRFGPFEHLGFDEAEIRVQFQVRFAVPFGMYRAHQPPVFGFPQLDTFPRPVVKPARFFMMEGPPFPPPDFPVEITRGERVGFDQQAVDFPEIILVLVAS